ncbi:hypothetical protein NPIL_116361 [Nephila pilipes]|uniref:Uncharacterized protein n=1 Tax=Nephila pilipes TaxID=299642 RepID=A0A8X6PWC2_NEPPI|nr:hypothetical protein NPIL_116361 [Nephila pilipes]
MVSVCRSGCSLCSRPALGGVFEDGTEAVGLLSQSSSSGCHAVIPRLQTCPVTWHPSQGSQLRLERGEEEARQDPPQAIVVTSLMRLTSAASTWYVWGPATILASMGPQSVCVSPSSAGLWSSSSRGNGEPLHFPAGGTRGPGKTINLLLPPASNPSSRRATATGL